MRSPKFCIVATDRNWQRRYFTVWNDWAQGYGAALFTNVPQEARRFSTREEAEIELCLIRPLLGLDRCHVANAYIECWPI